MTRLPEVPDTWTTRDLPVLAALVAQWDRTGKATSWEAVEPTGIEHVLVDRAGSALGDDGYIDVDFIDAEGFIVKSISGRARRTVGSWPTPETVADRLIEALERAVETATTDEERTKRRRALDSLRGLGRDLLVNATGSALGGAATGGIT